MNSTFDVQLIRGTVSQQSANTAKTQMKEGNDLLKSRWRNEGVQVKPHRRIKQRERRRSKEFRRLGKWSAVDEKGKGKKVACFWWGGGKLNGSL